MFEALEDKQSAPKVTASQNCVISCWERKIPDSVNYNSRPFSMAEQYTGDSAVNKVLYDVAIVHGPPGNRKNNHARRSGFMNAAPGTASTCLRSATLL